MAIRSLQLCILVFAIQQFTFTHAVTLAWDPNPESDLAGYRLFWGETNTAPSMRDVGNVTQAQVTNLVGGRTYFFYLTAYNTAGLESDPSTSVFYTQPEATPPAPSGLTASAVSPTEVRLAWTDNSTTETGFRLLRRTTGSAYATNSLAANTTSFTDTGLTPGTEYFYKLHAFNSAGSSAETAEVSVRTPEIPPVSGGARFLSADWNTGGSWKLNYGSDGYAIAADAQLNPGYATVTPSGDAQWIWNWETTDAAALQRAGGTTRLAACWYSPSSFQFDVPLSGSGPYRLSVYCLDWDMGGRAQALDILDRSTGQILNSQSISNFADGVYLTWEITKPVTIQVRPLAGANAVVSGVFFDSAAAVAAPEFSPAGGTFTNSVAVSISTATADATIRYSLDGSLPTASSPLYSGPITLTNSAVITARAFKAGMKDSLTASARFTLSGGTSERVRFIAANTTRGGTWKGTLGLEGQIIAYETPGLPPYASVTFTDASTWIWSFPTTSPAALERPYQNERLASTWYGSVFAANLTLRDTVPHRVSFYFVDFDNGGRAQLVEILDPETGAVLDSAEVSDFAGGVWLEYEITGSVIVRLTRAAGSNAVWSGMFFDSPASAASP